MDGSLLGSSVHEIFKERISFLSPGDLASLGIKPGSPELQADSSLSESPGKPFSLLLLPSIGCALLMIGALFDFKKVFLSYL